MATNEQDPADSPGFTPRRVVQQSSLGDLGPNVAPPPPPAYHKRNKWARR